MDIQERLKKIIEQKRNISSVIDDKINEKINVIKQKSVKDNSIAIIESHKKHAEVYPSVVKYFLDLGYNVDLFILDEHENMNSTLRCDFDKDKFRQFSFPIMPTNQAFYEILKQYKYIFLMTMFTHDGYYYINNLEKNLIKKYNRDNVYCIDHDFMSIQKNIETIEQRFLNNNKVFVLRNNIMYENKILPFVSPTYFGKVNITQKNTDIFNFISIGGGLQNNLRNFKLLFETVNQLINKGITNFKITFIINVLA